MTGGRIVTQLSWDGSTPYSVENRWRTQTPLVMVYSGSAMDRPIMSFGSCRSLSARTSTSACRNIFSGKTGRPTRSSNP
jgi:hypothetical protein